MSVPGWERLGGSSFVASVVVFLASLVAAPVVDDGTASVLAAAAVVLFCPAVIGVRHRATGRPTADFLLPIAALAVAAEIVGTTLRVSGVLLAVPVIAGMLVVVLRSDWRLGDVGLLVVFSGLGLGAAYLIDAAVHPDTGSQADQGAVFLVPLGLVMCLTAMALTRSLPARARVLIVIGAAGVVLGGLGGAVAGSWMLFAAGIPGGVLLAFGAGWIGIELRRRGS